MNLLDDTIPTGYHTPKMKIVCKSYDPGVITEISSAHGDKNSASSKQEKVIHGTRLIPQHGKRVKKLYKMTKKLKGALQNLGARAYVRNSNVQCAHKRTMRGCWEKNLCTF